MKTTSSLPSFLFLLTLVPLAAAPVAAKGFGSPEGVLLERAWVDVSRAGLEQGLHQELVAYTTPPSGPCAPIGGSGLHWQIVSDGTWLAQTVGLGNCGTQVFTEYGWYFNEAALLSAHDGPIATPVWVDQCLLPNTLPVVSSSSRMDVHVSLHQQFIDPDQVWRVPVVRKYGSGMAVPDWTYESPLLLSSLDRAEVEVSADGGRIVLVAYDAAAYGTSLTVFGPDSATPVAESTVNTLGSFKAQSLSPDGSTLAVSSNVTLCVIDTTTGALAWQDYVLGTPQYGALVVSNGGDYLAHGTLGVFHVLKREVGGAYTPLGSIELEPATYCRRLAISENGSTLVAGVHQFNDKSYVRFLALSLPELEVIFDTELTGGGDLQNQICKLECSTDGKRFAAGLWGDGDDLLPEVLAYSVDSTVPLLAEHLPGSVLDLDFADNGKWLAVASKGVHANVLGGGGAISLYTVGLQDVTVDGVPSIGNTVQLEHHLREGTATVFLVATALADEPIANSGLGEGLLYLDPATMITLSPTAADVNHVARTPYVIPSEASSIGTNLYLQAVDLDLPRLSRDWVKLTILP